MKKLFSLITLTSLTATLVAGIAAVFSVTGISKLFAGAFISTAIMAGSLELGKLVSVSVLYQNWGRLPRLLKTYLCVASVVLMIITSAGIYGYLSAAYAKVSAVPTQLAADVQIAQNRVTSINTDIDRRTYRVNQLIGLKSQQEARLDSMTMGSQMRNSAIVRAAQTSLTESDKTITLLQKEITNLESVRDSLQAVSIGTQTEIDTNSDIGTFLYISRAFDVSLDVVVKWFILTIVFVFDPLAVALVLAANFLVKNNRSEKEVVEEVMPELEIKDDYPDYAQEFSHIPILTPTPTPTPEEVKVEDTTPPTSALRTDPQYFARGDFDWSQTHLWKNDPVAINYYMKNKI